MFIYQLEHQYWKDDYDPSGFRIGYFSSLQKAQETRNAYLALPGFCDHPEGFQILLHLVNAATCEEIWSVDLAFDEYFDECIALGIYESRESAEKAAKAYESMRGAEVKQGEFFIESHAVDTPTWKEGFFTTYYTEE